MSAGMSGMSMDRSGRDSTNGGMYGGSGGGIGGGGGVLKGGSRDEIYKSVEAPTKPHFLEDVLRSPTRVCHTDWITKVGISNFQKLCFVESHIIPIIIIYILFHDHVFCAHPT